MNTVTHTVFIVDDHEAIRAAYRHFFEFNPDFSVVGEAASGREALEAIPACRPTVALVDISMREMDGLELTQRLRSNMPELKILVVSNRSEALWAGRVLRSGAHGFVSKQRFEADILEAIDTVLQGKTFASSAALDRKHPAAQA